ncbi:CAP domain-containing protein [Terrisporobacter sp.]|uniref:CAP domain-containing protein n=1 Tax=Terrisporobacter sp. TaxID=1965305 RepID=UPI0039929887
MNKKIKSLVMAGLVSIMAGSAVVSSNALCKDNVTTTSKKGAIYIFVNGKKHVINLGGINKPSQDNNQNNTNTGNNNNQNNNNTNTGNNDKPNNNKPNNNQNNNINTDKDNNTSNDNVTGEFAAFQKEVVRLVNVERQKQGLGKLSLNAKLSNVATLKSQDMINKNYFDHTSPTYGSPFDMMKQFNISYKTAGENIAKGQKTPAEVVKAWMNSQGHRENILNKNYTEIGIGVAKDANGTLYWTQMFIGK